MATPPQGSAVEAANEALADLRLSMDSPAPVERVTSLNGDIGRRGSQSNGTMHHADGQTHNALTLLREELKRTRGEKEALSTQYNNLVAKLTAMRTSLGNKLKQDAVSSTRAL
jgi:small-conductance mechanosensitive channel